MHSAAPTTLHIVCHTHWDREWYRPFQSFRLELVDTMDTLLDILDTEPAFRFLLDGQTAMIDDYLGVRPEREADLARFAAEGRLSVGPLRVLPDELLVSGETLVRNLQQGMRRAAELSAPMPVAYLPDMFGHTAQMPQLLRLCGLERAVVWRGVPSSVDRTLFRWEALDGTSVLASYLAASYSNAVALPLDPAALAARADALVAEQAAFGPPGHVLAMCGTDHWPPQRGLAAAVAGVGCLDGSNVTVVISSLEDYFAAAAGAVAGEELPSVAGELRSGWRANVLMGVTSTRADLKGLQGHAEATLERVAEPLRAIAGDESPAPLVAAAWSDLVLNSAHDSVCSCSSDETMTAVQARYEDALQVASGLATRGMGALARRVADPRTGEGEHSVVVWNPSPFPRSEVVALEVPVHWDTAEPEPRGVALESPDGALAAAAPVEWTEEVVLDVTLTGDQVMGYLPLVRSREFGNVFVNDVHVEADDAVVEVVLRAEPHVRGDLDMDSLTARVVALVEENPGRPFHVQLARLPTQRVLVRTPTVPPFGWVSLRAVPAADAIPGTDGVGVAVDDAATTLTNGLVTVTVNDDGTFAMTDHTVDVSAANLGGLVDGGDAGDTYNWSPPPVDLVVSRPATVTVGPVETAGGVLPRRSVLVQRRLRLPVGLADSDTARSDERVALDVAMTVTVTAGERRVDVAFEFDNTARDHRLRAHFPLPEKSTHSVADVAFGAVQRGLVTEGGAQESPLPTWPFRRFVDASGDACGLTLFTDRVLEYELSGGGSDLAVTLVRGTGFLSRSQPAMRPNPAGPVLAVRHAQSPGPHRVHLGLRLHGREWRVGEAAAEADRFALPLRTQTVAGPRDGDLAASGSPFRWDAPASVAVTSLHTDETGRAVVRLVNLADEPAAVSIEPHPAFARQWHSGSHAELVDLRGEVLSVVEDGSVELAPWQIATLRW